VVPSGFGGPRSGRELFGLFSYVTNQDRVRTTAGETCSALWPGVLGGRGWSQRVGTDLRRTEDAARYDSPYGFFKCPSRVSCLGFFDRRKQSGCQGQKRPPELVQVSFIKGVIVIRDKAPPICATPSVFTACRVFLPSVANNLKNLTVTGWGVSVDSEAKCLTLPRAPDPARIASQFDITSSG
jgi:hypothetical protein